MKRILAVATASIAIALGGCGGGDDEEQSAAPPDTNTGTTSEQPAPADGASTELQVDADPSGALAFQKDSVQAEAGEVTLVMDNPSSIPHSIAIEGNGVDVEGEVVDQDGTSRASADLAPGSYEYYCTVPGHREGGMEGELTVE